MVEKIQVAPVLSLSPSPPNAKTLPSPDKLTEQPVITLRWINQINPELVRTKVYNLIFYITIPCRGYSPLESFPDSFIPCGTNIDPL